MATNELAIFMFRKDNMEISVLDLSGESRSIPNPVKSFHEAFRDYRTFKQACLGTKVLRLSAEIKGHTSSKACANTSCMCKQGAWQHSQILQTCSLALQTRSPAAYSKQGSFPTALPHCKQGVLQPTANKVAFLQLCHTVNKVSCSLLQTRQLPYSSATL